MTNQPSHQNPPVGGRDFSRLTWAILIGGFLLGISFGGLFILGGTSGATDETNSSASNVARAEDAAEKAAAESKSTGAGDLADERDRLRQELEAEKLRHEVETLRQQLAEIKSSPVSTENGISQRSSDRDRQPVARQPRSQNATSAHAASSSPPKPAGSTGDSTLAYWNRMNEIILQEAALRAAPTGGVTAMNAGGFLEARIHAADIAVEGIRHLDPMGVDPRVLQLGEQLVGWYRDGRAVAESGKQLLTGGSVQERQGSAGKNYQASERSLAKRVNEINQDGEQVRQEMTRKYHKNFPPLN